MKDLNNENKLMYQLIFGEKNYNEISLFEYIDDISTVHKFTEKILSNSKKAGVIIKEDVLILTEDKNVWIIKK